MRRILINVLASAALLAVILVLADGAALWDRLRTVSSGWIGASVLAVSAATLSMARRWQLVARHVGLSGRAVINNLPTALGAIAQRP